MKPANVVIDFVESLEVKETKVGDGLFVAYLDSILETDLDYLTLDQALQQKQITIEEIEVAAVPKLRVKNKSDKKLLLLVGEQLQGQKQNRTINTTILVPEHQEIKIPVSCTEQGRWHYQENGVKSDHVLHLGARADLARDVGSTLGARGDFSGLQTRLWMNIAQTMRASRVNSRTGAAADLYDAYDTRTNGALRHLRKSCQAVGVLASMPELICVDAFSRRPTLDNMWAKLLKSYLMQAAGTTRARKLSPQGIKEFLRTIRDAELQVYQSPGLGHTVRIRAGKVHGTGLVYGEEVVHLSLFHKDNWERTKSRPDYFSDHIILDDLALVSQPGGRPNVEIGVEQRRVGIYS